MDHFVTSISLLLLIIVTIFLWTSSIFQFIKALKPMQYNIKKFREAQLFRKLLIILIILSFFLVSYWFYLIIRTWSGLWSIFLILFGASFPVVIYSTYFYHNCYYKQWKKIALPK